MVCPVGGSKGEAAGLVPTKEEAPHQGRLINFTQVFSEERLAIRVNILVGCGVQKGSDKWLECTYATIAARCCLSS